MSGDPRRSIIGICCLKLRPESVEWSVFRQSRHQGTRSSGQPFLGISYFLRWSDTCKVLDGLNEAGQQSTTATFRRELVSRASSLIQTHSYLSRSGSTVCHACPSRGLLKMSGGLRHFYGDADRPALEGPGEGYVRSCSGMSREGDSKGAAQINAR